MIVRHVRERSNMRTLIERSPCLRILSPTCQVQWPPDLRLTFQRELLSSHRSVIPLVFTVTFLVAASFSECFNASYPLHMWRCGSLLARPPARFPDVYSRQQQTHRRFVSPLNSSRSARSLPFHLMLLHSGSGNVVADLVGESAFIGASANFGVFS